MNQHTGFLFAMPSMVRGFARTLDVGGTFATYNVSATPADADWRALRADFAATADDLRASLRALVEDPQRV